MEGGRSEEEAIDAIEAKRESGRVGTTGRHGLAEKSGLVCTVRSSSGLVGSTLWSLDGQWRGGEWRDIAFLVVVTTPSIRRL